MCCDAPQRGVIALHYLMNSIREGFNTIQEQKKYQKITLADINEILKIYQLNSIERKPTDNYWIYHYTLTADQQKNQFLGWKDDSHVYKAIKELTTYNYFKAEEWNQLMNRQAGETHKKYENINFEIDNLKYGVRGLNYNYINFQNLIFQDRCFPSINMDFCVFNNLEIRKCKFNSGFRINDSIFKGTYNNEINNSDFCDTLYIMNNISDIIFNFSNNKINGRVFFSYNIFKSSFGDSISNNIFEKAVNFNNNDFSGRLEFSFNKFNNGITFLNTNFKIVPNFNGVNSLYNEFRFNLDNKNWQNFPHLIKREYKTGYEACIAYFSALKSLVKQSNDTKGELFFQAREFEAFRLRYKFDLFDNPKKFFLSNLIYLPYKLLSNYGTSILNPFLLLVIFMIYPYLWNFYFESLPFNTDTFKIDFTIQEWLEIIYPLNLEPKNFTKFFVMNKLIYVLLLFLLGLGIRNELRLR